MVRKKAISDQRSAVSKQRTANSGQRSAVSGQLSAVGAVVALVMVMAWAVLALDPVPGRAVMETGTNVISGAKFFLNGLWIGTNVQVTVNSSTQLVSVVNGVTNLLGGAGSITNIAAGYGISISSGYGPEATVTVDTNIIASQAWVTGLGFTTLAQVWSAGALTNNWTGGAVTLDAANANTNTFGGFLVIGPARYQANGATASGEGSWANFYALASGVGAWANNGATASGEGSWAMGVGAVATNDSFAFGAEAKATNTNTFVWSDETTAIGSTMNKQFTVYAANGYRLLGGPITGDGSGLTNLPPDASKANSNSVVTVVQTNSTGAAVTNQFTIGISNPTITLPTISAGGGSGVIPIALLPGSALTFGSTNRPVIEGLELGNVNSNNVDQLNFDPITVQGVSFQTVNHNSSGVLTNAILWDYSPIGGANTNVYGFGYAKWAVDSPPPSAWTLLQMVTNIVSATTNGLRRLNFSWTNSVSFGPCSFIVIRYATDASDNNPTNTFLVGGGIYGAVPE
jgi:hypothetical protein